MTLPHRSTASPSQTSAQRTTWLKRFVHWFRGLFRSGPKGGSGSPPNIYPLY